MAKKTLGRRQGGGKKPPPRCKALLLCERCIIEAATGNVSLINILSGFDVQSYPGLTGAFSAFSHLVDGIGEYDVTVEIDDLHDDVIIARTEPTHVAFPTRLAKANLVIRVPPLPLQHAGMYDFIVFVDGDELERQQFEARSAAGPEIGDVSDEG